MTALDSDRWHDLYHRSVAVAVEWVCVLLADRVPPTKRPWRPVWWRRDPARPSASAEAARRTWKGLEDQLVQAGYPSPLRRLAERFDLIPFEQNILLLCLAFETDARVGPLCGAVGGRPYPTFGLAAALFADRHWLAFPPERPLRRYRLIDCRQPAGTPLSGAELRLEETTLHFLRGYQSLDPRLAALAAAGGPPAGRRRAHVEAAERATAVMAGDDPPAVVQLIGRSPDDALGIAQAIARAAGRTVFSLSLDALRPDADLDRLAGLWGRDGTLFDLVLFADGHGADAARVRGLTAFAVAPPPAFLAVPERVPLAGVRSAYIECREPTAGEQRADWLRALPAGLDGREELAGELSRQFSMGTAGMRAAVAAVGPGEEPCAAVRRACRAASRPQLEGLAHRIEVAATWGDLVLADDRKRLLEDLRGQVRNRWRVYDAWGFADGQTRGLGITALFAGDSGTGKTLAAEVLANDLQLDLFRVDLSSVVNKYVGETEKHLRRLFDAFEHCGAVLFFDECDALFGKRGEVRDGHDRYANLEINYLLQRLESYRGLCVLATNNRGALDPAFLRRLRFVVPFAPPTEGERAAIWRKLLPDESAGGRPDRPVAALDYARLSRFPFSGGNIRTVVLNAAFRAAGRGAAARVTMPDVLAAARDECVKLERPIDEADFRYFEPAPAEEAA